MHIALLSLMFLLVAGCINHSGREAAEVGRYECDVAPGLFSGEQFQIPEEGIRVRGSMRIHDFKQHEKWKPSAGIAVRGDDVSKTAHIWFGIHTGTFRETLPSIIVEYFDGIDPKETVDLGIIDSASEPIRFDFELTRDGVINVTYGKKSFVGEKLDFKAKELLLGCSTSQATFTDVKFVKK